MAYESIKELRLQRGMTQAQLADASGVQTGETISMIETGYRKATMRAFKRLADALDVDVTDLILGQVLAIAGVAQKDRAEYLIGLMRDYNEVQPSVAG